MDPHQAWNTMLIAYATKQWSEALEHARALRDWLESDGFAPQPIVGTTLGDFTCQLDVHISKDICLAACCHIIERAILEVDDVA